MDQEKNTFSNNNSTTIGGVTFGGGISSANTQSATTEATNNTFVTTSQDPFSTASSSPFGDNGFSQAASSGNPNSNNQLAERAIANAANLAATQVKNTNSQNSTSDLNTPQTSLNVPVVSPTHFDFQTSTNPTIPPIPENELPQPIDPKTDPKAIALKSLKKMTTMSLVFGILMVIFLVLSIIGLVFGMSQGDKITTLEQTVATKNKIIKAVEETTGISNINKPEDVPVYKATTGYIYLTDWRIKIKIPDNLTSVSYILNSYAFRSSICFNAVQKGTQYKPSFADPGKNLGRQGCLSRIPVTDGDFDATTGIRFGTKVFTYKDYNYFYVDPVVFSTDSAEQGLENTANQLIRNMLTDNIEPYE
jgi:hypothetical protein